MEMDGMKKTLKKFESLKATVRDSQKLFVIYINEKGYLLDAK